MTFVLTAPTELHTIDVNDPCDPSIEPPEIEPKAETNGEAQANKQNPSIVVKMVQDNMSDSSESDSDNSDSDGSDTGDKSDSSDDDSTDADESDGSEADAPFEYDEVIDDASKTASDDVVHEEDLGGEAMATASAIAGVSVVSGLREKRTLIIVFVLAAVIACALYFFWRKIQDMKKKLCQLEQQQEMGINDRDVQLISSQVLQEFLQQERKEEGAQSRSDIQECSDEASYGVANALHEYSEEEHDPHRSDIDRLITIDECSDEASHGDTVVEDAKEDEPVEVSDIPSATSAAAAPIPPVETSHPAAPEPPVATPKAVAEPDRTAPPDAPLEPAEPAAAELVEVKEADLDSQPEGVAVQQTPTKRRSRRSKVQVD